MLFAPIYYHNLMDILCENSSYHDRYKNYVIDKLIVLLYILIHIIVSIYTIVCKYYETSNR